MSEAMSRREIEDVLTSIRRLVAQDSRSLTPQDVAPAAAPLAAAPSAEEPALDTHVDPVFDLHEVLLPAKASELDVPTQRTPKLVLGPALRVDDLSIPADPVPDTSPEDTKDGAPAALLFPSFAARQNVRQVAFEAPVAVPETSLAPAPAPTSAPEPEQPDVDETLARLEAMLTRSTPDPVPARAPQETGADPVIDEAMLHNLVADIVRQELQGELGEKITRAIRKLVRAEVARELQSHKL